MTQTQSGVSVNKVFAFSSHDGGGNPAGVVLDADQLSAVERQTLAAQVGLSETAFVSRSKTSGGFRLDFYTPIRKIADCGHATIAAFYLIARAHPELRNTHKEIDAGIRRVTIDQGLIFLEQPKPKVEVLTDASVVWDRLFPKSLVNVRGWVARHDVGFALFEVESESSLAALEPDLSAIEKLSHELDLVGIYVFVRTPKDALDATTRMFAPAYGIAEESATGMAAGLLSGLLAEGGAKKVFTIEQGRHMHPASPSLIHARIENDGVWVGGTARIENP